MDQLDEGIEEGDRFLGGMEVGFGHDLREGYPGAVEINDGIKGLVAEFAGVFLQVNPVEFNAAVFALHIPRGAGQLDLNETPQAKRLLVLRELIVLRRVGIKVIFAVPFTDFCDFTPEHEAQLRAGLNRGVVEHRQGSRQTQHHCVGQGIGFRAVVIGRRGEHLRARFELHVDFKTDDYVVFHDS